LVGIEVPAHEVSTVDGRQPLIRDGNRVDECVLARGEDDDLVRSRVLLQKGDVGIAPQPE
jgi:hypothetical protein